MFMNFMDYCDDKALIAFTQSQKERMHDAIDLYRPSLRTSNGCVVGTMRRACSVDPTISKSIYTENVENNSTVVHWMKSQAVAYEVRYRERDNNNWVVTGQITENQYTITGLNANKWYFVKVNHILAGPCAPVLGHETYFRVEPKINVSVPPPLDASNVRATATLITLTNTQNLERWHSSAVIYEQIDSFGDEDWFTFTTTSAAKNIGVRLSCLPLDYDLRVYKDNEEVYPVDYPNTPLAPFIQREHTIHNTSTTATYYIQVKGYRRDDFTPNYMYKLQIVTHPNNILGKRDFENDIFVNKQTELSLYPNPTRDMLNMAFETEEEISTNWKIFDLKGQVVMQQAIVATEGKNVLNLNVSNLSKGLYIVQIPLSNQILSEKLIIH